MEEVHHKERIRNSALLDLLNQTIVSSCLNECSLFWETVEHAVLQLNIILANGQVIYYTLVCLSCRIERFVHSNNGLAREIIVLEIGILHNQPESKLPRNSDLLIHACTLLGAEILLI